MVLRDCQWIKYHDTKESLGAKVAILALSNVKIKMRLALRYSVVVGMNMQIFGVYICSNGSILSLTVDSEGRIFFSDSTFSVSIWCARAFTFFSFFP